MVLYMKQPVSACIESEQDPAHKWRFREVEALLQNRIEPLPCLELSCLLGVSAEIDKRELDRPGRMHTLDWPRFRVMEAGAVYLGAAERLAQAFLKRRDRQYPLEAKLHPIAVAERLRTGFMDEPDSLLGEGKRTLSAARCGRDR